MNNKFKVGDRVKIIKKVIFDGWVRSMDEYIGKELVIDSIADKNEIKLDGWWFPSESIELVNADKKQHIHANSMKMYSEDAMETDEPWELWEYNNDTQERWYKMSSHPGWYKDFKYRRKQKTIKIGEFDVPEPVRNPLDKGETYYIADTSDDDPARMHWINDAIEHTWLNDGIIHLTKENAITHRDALLSFTKIRE